MIAPARTAPAPAAKAGIGLRAPHYVEVVETRPAVGWFEIHAENFMGGGPPLHYLETVRRDWPISVHGVGLSLGSADGLDPTHLDRLAQLVAQIEPALVSEHLAWSVFSGTYLNDLLPLPYTDETLALVARHVDQVQQRLGRQILVENPTAYLRFVDTGRDEADFLAELAQRTGCGLLCDVNNIYVNCRNHGGDPRQWLAGLPAAAVGEIHLAGHCVNDADGIEILIDDHGSKVIDPVWALYEEAVTRFPQAPTLIEWDSNIPSLTTLVEEAEAADRHRTARLGGGSHADAA